VHKPSVSSLFFSRQYSGSIDDRDTLQDRVRHVGTLKSVEESVAELGQRTELFLGINNEGVAWHHAFRVAVHHGDETIGGWFWANA